MKIDEVKLRRLMDGATVSSDAQILTEVPAFFDAVLACGVAFHPDTPFEDYVEMGNTEQRSFGEYEAGVLNRRLENCFKVCATFNQDIYAIGLDRLQAAGLLP